MPSFPHPREGTAVKPGGHPIRFLLYAPTDANQPTSDVGRMLASNPWKCMELHLAAQKRSAVRTQAFLKQAQEFFTAAEQAGPLSQPVLMYYGFLNLAKMLILHRNPGTDLSRALHGIGEPNDNIRKRFTLTSQKVLIQASRNGRVVVLNELAQTLGYGRLTVGKEWFVRDLLAQIPAIHRPFSHTLRTAERLYVIESGTFLHDHNTRRVWARLRVRRSEFPTAKARLRLNRRRYFGRVLSQVEAEDQQFFSFQSVPIHYGHSPLESLAELCLALRNAGVVSILTPGGYRHYISDFEPRTRVSPIVAAYMAMFFLGSVARYRPLDLGKMREGKFGWVIEEMLATQPDQFLYLAASELLEREVMRPWAVQ